jgi:hypothetical protein
MASTPARRLLLAAVAAAVLPLTLAAQKPAADPLARARQLYNEQKLDAAIQAAQDARRVPASANAAAVVLARAYLERFSQTGVASDLADARETLKQVDEARLTSREQVEFLVGLGHAFYLEGCLDGCFATAAEQFEQALARADELDTATRESLFEWWAVTLDKRAQLTPSESRKMIYARVLARAEREVARPESSASGLYWLAAAARGVDDLDRAWGAATAGWARARFLGPRGPELRAGLDRFVTQVLIPERARALAGANGDAKAALTGLEARWAAWKAKWE